MYIIEFIAPAGTGKTTLCNELINNNKKKFIGQNAIPSLKYFSLSLVLLLQKLGRHNMFKLIILKIFNLFYKLNASNLKYLLSTSNDDKCIEVYFKNICTSFSRKENIEKAKDRLSFFISSATRINMGRFYGKNAIGVFDEGYAQRGISLINHGVMLSDVNAYYKSTPLPNLLIVLKADCITIEERLTKRSSKDIIFMNTIDESIQSTQECKKIYLSRGCDILELNANDSLASNVELILNRLDND
jgi:hypothetical protein